MYKKALPLKTIYLFFFLITALLVPPVRVGAQEIHRVVRGDRLWRIARAHGTTWQALHVYNGLYNPHLIFAGQAVFIPGEPLVTRQIGRYVVQGPGMYVSFCPETGNYYFAGNGFPGFRNIGVEGSMETRENALEVRFSVECRFCPVAGVFHGTMGGTGGAAFFVDYSPSGNLVIVESHPCPTDSDIHEEFVLTLGNAWGLFYMLRNASQLVADARLNGIFR